MADKSTAFDGIIETAAKAWARWQKTKSPADESLVRMVVMVIVGKAKSLWLQPQATQVWLDVASIGIEAWQAIADGLPNVTTEQLRDAIVRTAILERTRARLIDEGVYDDAWVKQVWLTVGKISPIVLVYAFKTGKVTLHEMATDAQATAERLTKMATGAFGRAVPFVLFGGVLALALILRPQRVQLVSAKA